MQGTVVIGVLPRMESIVCEYQVTAVRDKRVLLK